MRLAARILELGAIRHETKPFIKRQGMRLCAEFRAVQPKRADVVQACFKKARPDAPMATGRQHADTADLARPLFDQDTRRSDRCTIQQSQDVMCLTVPSILFDRLWYTLFFDENGPSQGNAGGNVPRWRDMKGHAK